jgi:hypothetical protein
METLKLRPAVFLLLLLSAAGGIALVEYGGSVVEEGSLLVTLVFWSCLSQGAVAVVAITDLVGARWVASLKRELLSLYPLQFLVLLLFLLWTPRLSLYPWVAEPGLWLNEPFFIGRNLALLLLSSLLAALFARLSLREDRRAKGVAVLYLLAFVASQSLVAFDWVMTFEYPWYSTLFGAFFCVEGLYAGFALAGVASFLLRRQRCDADPETARKGLRDVGNLLFGFSVLWAGLFFAQYLLLWYGNLPEEVLYILRRTGSTSALALSGVFLVANFVLPFSVFLSRKGKRLPVVVGGVSLVVLGGLFVERVVYIFPVLSLHAGVLFAENVLILLVGMAAFYGRRTLLPRGGKGVRETVGGDGLED